MMIAQCANLLFVLFFITIAALGRQKIIIHQTVSSLMLSLAARHYKIFSLIIDLKTVTGHNIANDIDKHGSKTT